MSPYGPIGQEEGWHEDFELEARRHTSQETKEEEKIQELRDLASKEIQSS